MELVGLLPINTCNANRDVNSLFRVETIIENRDLLKLFNQNIRQFRNYAEGEKKKKNVTAMQCILLEISQEGESSI